MALKGTTRIELTNVKTGEKEVIEKDNLVTNAVPSILGDNSFAWQLKSTYSSGYFAGNMLPLCPNLFGGILLYEDAIPESVDQLYAQSSNKLIGYSSNIVNNKTDVMRGSMNPNESGELDSHDGYRFVFDFTTAQANGTISSVGLTSKWGGIAGYGSTEFRNTQSPTIACYAKNNISVDDLYTVRAYMTLLHYDKSTGIATSMYVSSQNIITVTRIQLLTKNWKLTRNMLPQDFSQGLILETQIIETKIFAGTTVSGKVLYHNLCDGGDGYIWGFEQSGNAGGNSSGSATVNWIKIKVDDLTFEEGTWEITAQLIAFGKRINNFGTLMNACPVETANCVVLDGYLYCLNYALTGLYRINLSNVTDITFFEHPDKKISCSNKLSNSGYYYYYNSVANLVKAGNKVCMWNGYLNGDAIVANITSNVSNVDVSTGRNETLDDGWINTSDNWNYPKRNCVGGTCGLDLGVISLGFSGSGSTSGGLTLYGEIILNSPYLATINNLPTPVEKTADKTMKITYILREE